MTERRNTLVILDAVQWRDLFYMEDPEINPIAPKIRMSVLI